MLSNMEKIDIIVNMEDIKNIVSQRLVELRKREKLTQSELAEKLNYSDKTISKWERGESLPDFGVIVSLCELYNVSLDYLIAPEGKIKNKYKKTKQNKINQFIITALAAMVIWVLAAVIYLYSNLENFCNENWQVFVWAIPISTVIIFIFNSIWGNRKYNFFILSIVLWTLITSIFLTIQSINLWPIWIAGIPIQVIIILWSQLKLKS